MAPIPVHTKSPINAAKAEGITPKTADNDVNGHSGAAQPGASPNNAPAAPTDSIQNQLHAPLQPTPAQKITPGGMGSNDTPPPPQPGAVPYPPASRTAMAPPPGAPGNTHYASPPPPATTQAAVLPGTGTGHTSGGVTYPNLTPPQMGMSLAEPAAPHTYRGTSTAPTTTAAPGSQQVGYNAADSSGGYPGYPPPGGYQQNPNASGPPYEQSRGNDSTSVGAGSGNYQDDGDEGGVWNSAMKWAQSAGEKLSAAESEVWKRINKE